VRMPFSVDNLPGIFLTKRVQMLYSLYISLEDINS
jgi:hypothetical protein